MQIYNKWLVLLALGLVILGAAVFSLMKYSHLENYIPLKGPIKIDMARALEKDNCIPLLVIGSGCAGYSAAIYGARGKVKTVLFVGNKPGGQLSGTSTVENWPGLFQELGPDIMQKLKKQAENFGVQVVNDTISTLDTSVWPFAVTTEDGKKLHALTIIIATGATPVMLNVPGEQEYFGKGVTTCAVCDAPFHKDKDVIIVGGGDSAAEEALQLSAYAKSVTLAVRRNEMRASPSMQERVANVDKIHIAYNTEVKSIVGDEHAVTGVQLYNNGTQETEYKVVTGVFLAIGHTPNSALVKNQLETDKDGYIIVQGRSQQTSVPGIFAAGDVEDKVYRQAGVASGSGIRAALDALNFLQNNGFNAAIAKKMKPHYYKPEAQRASSVIKLTTMAEFDEIRKTKRIFVLDFYTNFCPSCMQMMPALEAVAYKLVDRVAFCKVDASQLLELAQTYHVVAVPAILVFKDGSLVGRYNQAMNKKQLYEFVERFL